MDQPSRILRLISIVYGMPQQSRTGSAIETIALPGDSEAKVKCRMSKAGGVFLSSRRCFLT
jgi:hypothetical protein